MPKTGTTLLQRGLFKQHPEIHYLGKTGGEWVSDDIRDSVNTVADCRELSASAVERFQETVSADSRVTVASREGLCSGPLPNHRFRIGQFSRIGRIKAIVFVRNPYRFVESYYFQMVRASVLTGAAKTPGAVAAHLLSEPYFLEIGPWLALQQEQYAQSLRLNAQVNRTIMTEGVFRFLHYADAIQCYVESLGRENVAVFLFEELRENLEGTIRCVCESLGVDSATGIELLQNRSDNLRWSKAHWDEIRRIRRSVWRSARFSLATRRKRLSLIDAGVQRAGPTTERARAPIPPVWRDEIDRRTRRGNRWLQDHLGLPLEQHGYPV